MAKQIKPLDAHNIFVLNDYNFYIITFGTPQIKFLAYLKCDFYELFI